MISEPDDRAQPVFCSEDGRESILLEHCHSYESGNLEMFVSITALLDNKLAGPTKRACLFPDEAEQLAYHLLRMAASARAVTKTADASNPAA